mgnify:CR=1 FL=1
MPLDQQTHIYGCFGRQPRRFAALDLLADTRVDARVWITCMLGDTRGPLDVGTVGATSHAHHHQAAAATAQHRPSRVWR